MGEEEAVFSTAPPRTIAKAQFPPRETNAGKKEECWERLGEVEGWTQETRIQMERTPPTCFLTLYFHFPPFLFLVWTLCRQQGSVGSKNEKRVQVEDWFLSDFINFFILGIEAVGKRTYCTKNRNTHYKFHIVSIVLMLERLDCIFSRFILSQENL